MKRLTIFIFVLLSLVACSTTADAPKNTTTISSPSTTNPVSNLQIQPSATEAMYLLPSSTQTASPTPGTTRQIATPSQTPAITDTPAPTQIPISEDDPFLTGMQAQGYSIVQYGSIVDDNGSIYSAYLFKEPQSAVNDRRDYVVAESWIIAFYLWDGENNKYLNSSSAAPFRRNDLESGYPAIYRLVNWDDPYETYLPFDFMFEQDEETVEALQLDEFRSDYNRNDRPEFSFIAQYCPVSCSRPTYDYHIFEVNADQEFVDLAAGMPGHLHLSPFSNDPLIRLASEQYWYGYLSIISLPYYYEWKNDTFVDITKRYQADILEWLEESEAEIKQAYGSDEFYERTEAEILRLLLTYQHLGMRQTGYEIFMELTNPANWPDISPETACWLQLSRSQAQVEYMTNSLFTLPPSSLYIDTRTSTFYLSNLLDGYDETVYDLSACRALLP